MLRWREPREPLRPLAGEGDREEVDRLSNGASESLDVCGWREGERPRPAG